MTPPPEFRSDRYEFSDEHNKAFSRLADAMRSVGSLLLLLGLSFTVFFALLMYHAAETSGNYGPAAGVGAAMVLFLAMGFWTGSAAHSFRRIVETKNEDVWHLMNAVGSLTNMYGTIRALALLGLVLVVVGVSLLAVTWSRG